MKLTVVETWRKRGLSFNGGVVSEVRGSEVRSKERDYVPLCKIKRGHLTPVQPRLQLLLIRPSVGVGLPWIKG